MTSRKEQRCKHGYRCNPEKRLNPAQMYGGMSIDDSRLSPVLFGYKQLGYVP